VTPLVSRRAAALSGDMAIPGDKSISHRSLMIAAVAVGESRISGLLEGEDVLATAAAMRLLGADVERAADGVWHVHGRGVGGLAEPARVLDLGNAGTSARLLMGLLASHPFTSFLTGDGSLRRRPMKRVMTPLMQMGAEFTARSGHRLPMAVSGTATPLPITYELPVASAQVKSAILLAGLNTAGTTRVIEPKPTRDHSELMLRHFGAEVAVESVDGGGRAISLTGQPEITGRRVVVPGDISSAAFPLVAALLVPDSQVIMRGVGVNPLRTGLVRTLLDMGADISLANERHEAGEPVADMVVKAGPLSGVEVPVERVPTMIDEFPVLAVAAAMAGGETRMAGLGELRVKESDRLGAMARGLAACGIEVEEGPDTLVVRGGGGRAPAGGATIATDLDHRIAMAFLVLGMVTEKPVTVDDGAPVETSFPGFAALMNGLGGRIDTAREENP
jgi:3-phosphoshikimate 1-carboxyvinyltransferase